MANRIYSETLHELERAYGPGGVLRHVTNSCTPISRHTDFTSLWLRHLKQTALTRGFTGRLARGLKNRLLEEFNQKDIEILPYPLQRALVRHLSIPAEKAGKSELLPLWGAEPNLSRSTNVRVLLDTFVEEISEIAGAVQNWSTHRQALALERSEMEV